MSNTRLLNEDELDGIVQEYDIEIRSLLKSQRSKMRRFLKEGCVVELGGNRWKVLPISGYNTQTYTVIFDKLSGWDCNCQFKSLEGRTCSHIGCIMLWLMRKTNESITK